MATTEIVLNEYIGIELRKLYTKWSNSGVVNSENTAVFASTGKRPDIIVVENPSSPVCIETEFSPANTVEADAISRLGELYGPTGSKITCSFAVKIPTKYKDIKSSHISESLLDEQELEYCIFYGEEPSNFHRWPSNGFLPCTLLDLGNAIAASGVSPVLIEQGANNLEVGAKLIAAQFEVAKGSHKSFASQISECLRQESSDQTYRMAATIVINALVFQETIAGGEGALADVKSPYSMSESSNGPSKLEVMDEWRKILKINYWPIFGIARKIVSVIPASIWKQVYTVAFSTADKLLSLNLGKNPDLVGTIFQRLISDRRFLATFYTAPSSAALVSGLVVRDRIQFDKKWSDIDALSNLKIADFACGTGSLLCSAYQEIKKKLENAGVDSAAHHKHMIENVIVGCDVLPSATHITASQLTSTHPEIRYNETKILTLPFGLSEEGVVGLGAFDLLETQAAFSTIATGAVGVGASEEQEVDVWQVLGGTAVTDQSFDIIVMNPPFTRLTGGGGKSESVSRPLFAAFKTTAATQALMSKKFSKLFSNSCYHGNAGAGSAFVEVGHRKLKDGGTMGLILHLSALSGESWEKCRMLWRKNYRDIMVLSIAGHTGHEMAFSADTGVGECLWVGTRTSTPSKRYISVSLYRRPESVLEGAELARRIRVLTESDGLASLESGPLGGTSISIGNEKVGELISAPLPKDGPWPLFRIADHSLAQTAYQLIELGRCWLPGLSAPSVVSTKFCKLFDLGEAGPYHLDIAGTEISGGAPRGPFELKETSNPASASYPVLKAHNEARERFLEISADAEGFPHTSKNPAVSKILEERRDNIVNSRTRLHFATDLQFNSNALVAVLTDRPSIGGRAWPSFKLANRGFEKFSVIWFNSTFGILAFWWIANKAQSGRGSVTTSRLGDLTLPDPRGFSVEELEVIDAFYEKMKTKHINDIHECADDPVRSEIDNFVIDRLIRAKDKQDAYYEAIKLVRNKIALEPTVAGDRGTVN